MGRLEPQQDPHAPHSAMPPADRAPKATALLAPGEIQLACPACILEWDGQSWQHERSRVLRRRTAWPTMPWQPGTPRRARQRAEAAASDALIARQARAGRTTVAAARRRYLARQPHRGLAAGRADPLGRGGSDREGRGYGR